MSLAQQLFLRALVAWFWEKPYKRKLIPWGTEIHDRFMLPDFIWQDFKDVIADLRDAGFPIELEWFAPHFEFRFPVYGSVTYDGIELELRPALEPWHVMGEEGAPGGTARYVDSSLERLQVKVKGNLGSRYQVTCNGITRAAQAHRHAWRIGGRRALPRLAAVAMLATHHPAAHAAGVRSGRQLGRPLHRRLPLSRRPSGRPLARHLPRQRARGGDAPARALRDNRAHARADAALRSWHEPVFPAYARPAAHRVLMFRQGLSQAFANPKPLSYHRWAGEPG